MEHRKYWLFFSKETTDIYAFTDNRKTANNFKKTRNMKKFICKKCELDRKSINELIKYYMTSELKMFEGMTKNDKYEYKQFSIALTTFETHDCEVMSSLLSSDILSRYAFENIIFLKDKYKNALYKLLYNVVHDYINGSEDSYNIMQDFIYPDQFNIIMDRYGDLFKLGGK